MSSISIRITVLLLFAIFSVSQGQSYILEVELLTYFNNLETSCTGSNNCGAIYRYCLREYSVEKTAADCLSDERQSSVPQELATNIALNIKETFVVNSSFPESASDRIQFFFEAIAFEENVGTVPFESFSINIHINTNNTYTEVLSFMSDDGIPPAGVLEARFKARCMENFFGEGCSVLCIPQNDNTLGHFSCDAQGNVKCLPGYCGPERRCVEECTKCSDDLCMNGGTCSDHIDGFNCSCVEGYTGRTCEEDESSGETQRLIGTVAGSVGGALIILVIVVFLCILIKCWYSRQKRKFTFQPDDVDPRRFEPVTVFHDNQVMDFTDSHLYRTNIKKGDAVSEFSEEDRAPRVLVNLAHLEQHLYDSVSDLEEPDEVVHAETNHNNVVILSTSRETTI